MHPTRAYFSSLVTDPNQNLAPPGLFKGLAIFGTVGVSCYILVSILFTPASDPKFNFGENGAVTALSSVALAMSGALALIIFYLRIGDWNTGSLFWLVLAAGCVFLSLDEQLMFHERGGHAIEATGMGEANFFRNWNDLIVIGYGVVALTIAAMFGREILKCRTFAAFFAIGFLFYAVHTGIDSTVSESIAWKDIPEESAKLMGVFSLFLALCAQLLALLENLLGASSPSRGFGAVREPEPYASSKTV